MKKSFRDLRKKLSLKAQKQAAEKTTDMISAMPLQELRPYCLSKYKKTVDPVMRQVHKAGEKRL